MGNYNLSESGGAKFIPGNAAEVFSTYLSFARTIAEDADEREREETVARAKAEFAWLGDRQVGVEAGAVGAVYPSPELYGPVLSRHH